MKISGPTVLALLLLLSQHAAISAPEAQVKNSEKPSGTFEKMIVVGGSVTIDLELDWLTRSQSNVREAKREMLRFGVDSSSFLTIRVFNNLLRGADPGSMKLKLESPSSLPEPLTAAAGQLRLEKLRSGGRYEFIVRNERSGTVIFNVEGDMLDYDPSTHSLSMRAARLLVSEELAAQLGHGIRAGTVAGEISLQTTVYPIEITALVDGTTKSMQLPPRRGSPVNAPNGGRVPGPDIVVGDVPAMVQAGVAGAYVGLGIATTACNNGDQEVFFFSFPDTRHSAIAQNFYRMSGGASNTDRFEQIGQGYAKHAFGANQDDDCGFGCIPAQDFSHLGVGCSDPYGAGQNATYGLLGSRAWINPFTGTFPASSANHTGHVHTGTSHRLMVAIDDLNQTMNPGATYYAEISYDIGQEYDWCQAHPGQCNMYNNATYRRYNVSGTTAFTFAPAGSPHQTMEAIRAWTDATINAIEPEPGVDGRALIGYKITGPTAGLWHYEYALYNRNLDRAIQSFSVPLGAGASISNIGFHAPINPLGASNDGTLNNAGFSNAAWAPTQTATDLTWTSETFAQNPNANAIRWGTMYNFRFDSDQPPQATNATVGFFKTGAPITVAIQAPGPVGGVTPTPTPGGSPTPTPSGISQALNLSTRLDVGTGNSVGIGGFIITGNDPVRVIVRAIGPSLSSTGVDALADPVLGLNGSGGFLGIVNDNWRETQEAEIIATGIPPTNDLESAIVATLVPGAYTAVISGNNNTTGIGLVEVYNLSQIETSKLANISTRAFVGTGNAVVIAGFILGGGSSNTTIVLRGLGPSIPGGIAPLLADPVLQLYNGSGTLLNSNNDWQSDPAQAALCMELGLAPANPAESCIVESLPPGSYTALARGNNGGTGVGLVEVYEVPASPPTPTSTPGPTPTPEGSATPPPPTPTATPSLCTENFDGVTAPALPAGWDASNPDPGDGVMWTTSTVTPDSSPNCAFVPDQDGISDKVLDRTNVAVQSASSMLSFRNYYNLEASGGVFFDRGVLEISTPSISNGDFLDFTDPQVGAKCLSGCYTAVIPPGAARRGIDGEPSGPITGGGGWGGDSGGYIDTVIDLGPNLNGQTVTFRWRLITDEAVAGPGWRIDDLSITEASCP